MNILKNFLICFYIIMLIPTTSTFNCFKLSLTETKDRLELVKERGVLNIASSNDIPFSYIDTKKNQFSGIDAEILTEAAKRLGIKRVELKYQVPFDKLLTELVNNDDIDIVADGMYITDKRKEYALFTDPIYKESEAIVTPKISRIVSKADLKTATVGVQNGTEFLNLAENWKDQGLIKNIKVFDTLSDVFSAVNTSKVDAAITDSISAQYTFFNDKSLYLRILSSKEYTPEAPGVIGMALRKSDISLQTALNEKLDEMKRDRTILKILKKYGLNEDYYIPYVYK